jgi:hypothetical protein
VAEFEFCHPGGSKFGWMYRRLAVVPCKKRKYICPSEVKQKGVVVWLRFKKFIILAPRVCVRGWSVVSGNSCGYMDAIPAGRDVY